MSERLLRVRGCDPLLFRDGRPFADELGALTAQSLALPLPGTLAGLLRSRLGDSPGWTWDEAAAERACRMEIAGPILLQNGRPVFPAPRDAVVYEKDKAAALMPLRPGDVGGCDLPDGGLAPLTITQDVKPLSGYSYWPLEAMDQWLASPTGRDFDSLPPNIIGLPHESRTHVAMNSKTGAGEEGKLFNAEFVAFEEHGWKDRVKETDDEWALLARVTTDETAPLSGASPFGGERRLAHLADEDGAAWPACPAAVKAALTGKTHLRLVLATPALFSGGWKPGWLNGKALPALGGARLTLKAAAVGRREPVSGWDFQKRRPKPVRWMAPAGSVFFFELAGADPAALAETCWLEPVSDDEQDRRDGYGLALWGAWNA